MCMTVDREFPADRVAHADRVLSPDRPRALIIEDDEVCCDRLRAMLVKLGWAFETAGNGAIGRQLAQRREFDVAICDTVMPDHSGFETIRSIRNDQPSVHIVAIPGDGMARRDQYLEMARRFGADDLLPRPFGIYDLLKAMRGYGAPVRVAAPGANG